jgi:phenylpyruvate tautomerase PptA (4-oxalocrotonate tautomerase family)
MPLITVDYPTGSLTPEQKAQLAEEMTKVILEIEGGADTPGGRSIAWVRFKEMPNDDWYIGGTNDGSYTSPTGKFLIELNVPEGSTDQVRKTAAHKAITAAFLRVTGVKDEEGAARSVWIQIFEWPEGCLATNNKTSSLLGIARLAGVPKDHPLLDYPRAYFDAKDRMYDAHQFPPTTAGRALVRY